MKFSCFPHFSPVYCAGLPNLSPWPQASLQRVSFSTHRTKSRYWAQPLSLRILCLHRCFLSYLPCGSCSHAVLPPGHLTHFPPKQALLFSDLCAFSQVFLEPGIPVPFSKFYSFFKISVNASPTLWPSVMLSQPPLSHIAGIIHSHIVHCIRYCVHRHLPHEPQRHELQ